MATKTYSLKTIGDETLDACHAKLAEAREIVTPSDYEFIAQRLIDELLEQAAERQSSDAR